MHCPNCGEKIEAKAFRCPGCGYFSITFWLALITAVAWLVIVAMNYVLVWCLDPLATFCAHLGADIPPVMLWNFSWSNTVQTYGVLILVVLVAGLPRLIKSFGRYPRMGQGVAIFSIISLVLIAITAVADSRSIQSLGGDLDKLMNQEDVERSEMHGRDAVRRVIVAEYRYRELHPKIGFTCNFQLLETLGVPSKNDFVYSDKRRSTPDKIGYDIYTLSLRECHGMPATKYELSAVRDPSFGSLFEKAVAFCSDGSGELFSSADGKAETCLSARTPLHW